MDLKHMSSVVLLFLTGDFIQSLVCSIVVNIAILVPYGTEYQFTMMISRPAIDLTVWRLQRRGLFTKDKVKLNYADSKCSSAHAPIEAFKFHNRSINAYLGPVCDFALSPVGRYAAVWDIPVISPGGFSHSFLTDKREFTTLTRVGLTFNSMAQCMDDIFKVNQWDKILVMYEIQGYQNVGDKICYLAASAMIYFSKIAKYRPPYRYALFEPGRHDLKKLLMEEVGLNVADCPFEKSLEPSSDPSPREVFTKQPLDCLHTLSHLPLSRTNG